MGYMYFKIEISFVLAMISIALIEVTPVPFIIFLIIYFGCSFAATYMSTPIGKFFDYTIPKGDAGNIGCIIAPLYMIVYPIIGFVACIIGPFALIAEISKDK